MTAWRNGETDGVVVVVEMGMVGVSVIILISVDQGCINALAGLLASRNLEPQIMAKARWVDTATEA